MKAFFEEYGRILVSALVILLFVVSASPLGGSIKDGITGVVQSMNRLGSNGEGSGGGNGGSGSEEVTKLGAGLYDADDNLVADWDTLVNTYGMDVEKDYNYSTYPSYNTDSHSPYYVLSNNSDLSSGVKLVISEDITSIGSYAFYKDNHLTSVIIPEGVTSIGSNAWGQCKSLISVTIPSTITSFKQAFIGCTGLTSVAISEGVTIIDNSAFNSCYSLTSITIPNTVTSIGSGAFAGSGLTSITIPSSVTTIMNQAFNNCTSLTSITISEGVTSIGEQAFSGCSSLTTVTIPSTVTSIESWAFSGCTGLTSVYFKQTTVPTFKSYCLNKDSGDMCTFYFKNSTVADAFTTSHYKASFGTKSTDYSW